VIIAPGRAQRPGAARGKLEPPTQEELDTCPFCAGREDRTPPETLVLSEEGSWRVRVVPNLYPAFERQEVVVHSPEHVRSIADLSDDQLALVAEAWHNRTEAARAEGFSYVQVLINEGRDAGASLPHSHSQLVWLREPPPAVLAERENLRDEHCDLCDTLAQELEGGSRLVFDHGGVVLISAYAARAPYELLVAPLEHSPEREDGRVFLERALALIAEAVRRLHTVEGAVPLNIWLHSSGHWHFEVLPRLSVFAGLELGAGLYVNWLPPEEAAQRLRSAAV
jgi:UDPglucose--hexose-1-phosphate uridylyltransferase